jgi:hypothetical protein
MGKLGRSILLVIPLIVSACGSQVSQVQLPEQESFPYENVLGNSFSDLTGVDWMDTSHCVSENQFQICKDIGMAFWLDPNKNVEQIYLYLNNEAGFAPYQGELPLGLKFYDTMGAVEYKLRKMEASESSLINERAGLPDEGGSPDHFHYWATYRRYGLTIIYNSPFTDEDATIYAIVLSS